MIVAPRGDRPAQPRRSAILPPAQLGVLGGGQLGRYFTWAARRMGYRVMVLDPNPAAPAAALADSFLQAAYDDPHALHTLAEHCAAITIEFENVPAAALRWLGKQRPTWPDHRMVAIVQDRIAEKKWLNSSGFPTVPYVALADRAALETQEAVCISCLPGILKTARMGYDGKGQQRVADLAALRAAHAALGHAPCVLERQMVLVQEISVIVARSNPQECVCYPPIENRHHNGILDLSLTPAPLADDLVQQATVLGRRIADTLDYVGVLAVEMFVLEDTATQAEGVQSLRLVVNELAPRPHNSGHSTLDAALTSQFEQQVRTLCGLYPGRTDLLRPAVMVNLLGNLWGVNADGQYAREPDWSMLLEAPNVKLHLYGKHAARPGRKMGHYTVLADTLDEALEQALALRSLLPPASAGL